MNHPSNIWLVTEEEFDNFTYTGGKVIYIVEEPKALFIKHPATITAGVLLPPVEAIHAELDGFGDTAYSIYEQYLKQSEAAIYVNILLTAAVLGNPIGLMFGKDELELDFPKMFINYLYNNYGLVIGVANRIQSYIEEAFMPVVLATLMNADMIDYPAFIMLHPVNYPILPMVIPKLVNEIRPLLSKGETYEMYFDRMKNESHRRGRLVRDPLERL